MRAGQRLRDAPAPPLAPEPTRARNPALEIFIWSRLAVWAGAAFAFLWFEPNRHPGAPWWDMEFNHDLGWATDIWARWDSGWFLRIAEHSYASDPAHAPAFFPLYPSMIAVLGRVLGGHFLLAGLALSLASGLAAFLLLYRLAETRLGAEGARRTVLYLALFPTSLFLQAVYSESLFLLLTVAAFALAERNRWLPAAAATGLAILTRPVGIALLPALAVLAWRSPERPRAFASLGLAAASFVFYPLLLLWQVRDPFAFLKAQDQWFRELSPLGPLGGIWHALRAGVAGTRQLVVGREAGRSYWPIEGADAMHAAVVNLSTLAYLVLFFVLTVIAWRRFGAPYGLFAALSLAIPLSLPSERWPLLSLPRFGLVVFPLFLALATLGARPRVHTAIVGVSGIFLGIAVVQWALWQWVA